MSGPLPTPTDNTPSLLIPVGEDRFGEFKVLGISSIAVKLSSQESGDVFIAEITLQQKGGQRNTCTMIRLNGFTPWKVI